MEDFVPDYKKSKISTTVTPNVINLQNGFRCSDLVPDLDEDLGPETVRFYVRELVTLSI